MVGGKKGGLPVTVGLNVGLFVGLNVTGLKWKIHIFLENCFCYSLSERSGVHPEGPFWYTVILIRRI